MSAPLLGHAPPRLVALRRRLAATALHRRLAATAVVRRIDEVRPTPAWKVASSVVYSGLIAVAVMGVAVLLLGVKPSSPEVAQVSAVEVGDCVTVAGGNAARTGCDADGLHFAVAEKLGAKTACSVPSYARVESGGATLCVVPMLALGDCYQVKPDKAATTDIRQVTCPTAMGSAPSNVIRVTERAVGAPLSCRGSSALNYAAPQRISYCIAPVN